MNKTSLLFLGIGALLLTGLFVMLKPASAPVSVKDTAATIAGPEAKPIKSTQVFEIVMAHGAKRSGPDVMRVTQGDAVRLHISSDHADELHVHGYDLHAKIQPGTPTVLDFEADRSGRFTMELHHSHVELGALEVLPR